MRTGAKHWGKEKLTPRVVTARAREGGVCSVFKRLWGEVQDIPPFLASLRDSWGRTGPRWTAGVLEAAGGSAFPTGISWLHPVFVGFVNPKPGDPARQSGGWVGGLGETSLPVWAGVDVPW